MRRVAVALTLALAGCSTSPVASMSPPPLAAVVSGPARTTVPSPTPVGSTVALGPLDDNDVPTSLEGEVVLSGAALRSAIRTTREATPFLAGGWFHPPMVVRYCSLIRGDDAVGLCYSFGLFEQRVGGAPIWVAPGDVRDAGTIAGAVERPVVLRVHTHDPRCGDDASCPTRPVLDEMAWLGEEPLASAPPRAIGTPPAGGISREKAIDRAIAESMPHTTPLELVSATAVPLWSVLPSEETSYGEIWVWVIVFDSHFPAPCGDDCNGHAEREEVFLEFLDGGLVMARWSPAAPLDAFMAQEGAPGAP